MIKCLHLSDTVIWVKFFKTYILHFSSFLVSTFSWVTTLWNEYDMRYCINNGNNVHKLNRGTLLTFILCMVCTIFQIFFHFFFSSFFFFFFFRKRNYLESVPFIVDPVCQTWRRQCSERRIFIWSANLLFNTDSMLSKSHYYRVSQCMNYMKSIFHYFFDKFLWFQWFFCCNEWFRIYYYVFMFQFLSNVEKTHSQPHHSFGKKLKGNPIPIGI